MQIREVMMSYTEPSFGDMCKNDDNDIKLGQIHLRSGGILFTN